MFSTLSDSEADSHRELKGPWSAGAEDCVNRAVGWPNELLLRRTALKAQKVISTLNLAQTSASQILLGVAAALEGRLIH